MATLFTLTVTFDDGSSLTNAEAHEVVAELSDVVIKALKRRTELTAVSPDFSAADTLGITVT